MNVSALAAGVGATRRPSALVTGAAAVAGTAALAGRVPGSAAVVATASIGLLVFASPPVETGRRPQSGVVRWIAAVAFGVFAFALTRAMGPLAVAPGGAIAATAAAVSGVAEEAFFRGFMYRWLERYGAAVAVATTAIAFAAVHVPMHGLAVLPLDLAAGLLLSWQRWATGGWTAPAATHVVANLMQFS